MSVAEDLRKLTPLQREAERLRNRREAQRLVDAEERGTVSPPPIYTLRELLATPELTITWTIEGWQPANSRIILAAQFKAGKTTLICNLIRSLRDGDKWLGVCRDACRRDHRAHGL